MRRTRVWSQIVMMVVLCLCLGACTTRSEQAPAVAKVEEHSPPSAQEVSEAEGTLEEMLEQADALIQRADKKDIPDLDDSAAQAAEFAALLVMCPDVDGVNGSGPRSPTM